MNHILHCGALSAVVSDKGGELCSLCVDSNEAIWQGDAIHWNAHAPMLFPICGKVQNDRYSWQGKYYPMPIHGFLSASQMSVLSADQTSVSLLLTDSDLSRPVYPFSFAIGLDWALTDASLTCTATVRANETALPFSFGAHPGFALPYGEQGFKDASIVFAGDAPVRKVELTENGFFKGVFSDFELTDGRCLPLDPDPALGCGLFLEVPSDARSLTLSADALSFDLRIDFPDFPYLGLWHDGGSFICIEPWQGLPAPDADESAFENKPASILLAPGEQRQFVFAITPLAKSE